MRDDGGPESGAPAGSDPELMREQHIDPYDIEHVILNATGMLTLGVTPNEDYAAPLASAHNDWLVDYWLEAGDCFKGGLVVAPQAPNRGTPGTLIGQRTSQRTYPTSTSEGGAGQLISGLEYGRLTAPAPDLLIRKVSIPLLDVV